MNMTSVCSQPNVGHSDLSFVDFVLIYIKKWRRPGVFVPHWALALVSY